MAEHTVVPERVENIGICKEFSHANHASVISMADSVDTNMKESLRKNEAWYFCEPWLAVALNWR